MLTFEPLDIATASVARRRFVRHRNGDPDPSRTRLRHAFGREAGPDRPPRVSILIPTADGQRFGYLPRLLEQIDAQTYQSIEVFVVEGDNRQGRAINTAAALARGDYLLTFDDDTRLGTPAVIHRLVEALDSDPRIGMAGVANRVPEDASWVVRRVMAEAPRRSSPPVAEIMDSDLAEHPCLAMRREVFYQVGGEHEIIPRGLDPYLRQEFRRAGYRVVVIPGAWIHHLPPPTLGKTLRQYYRNGQLSVLVSRQFPELALDNATRHGEQRITAKPLWFRMLRHAGRLLLAFFTLKWVYLLCAASYALGALVGCLIPLPQPELHPEPGA